MVTSDDLKYVQYILVNKDVEMGKGKMAAQVGHAAIEGYDLMREEKPELATAWKREGQRKIVLKATKEEIKSLMKKLSIVNLDILQINKIAINDTVLYTTIKDFGLTQIPVGTLTCMVIGPDLKSKIEPHVKNFKLM
jgi:peptidyl-tRNA hydrolase, PTH2 family